MADNLTNPYISAPSIINRAGGADRLDRKVSQWIEPYAAGAAFDVGLIGVPLSRSSISASAASENPNAMRLAWKGFGTWYADYDTDVCDLRVCDIGDIKMHVTDILQCQSNIEAGLTQLYQDIPDMIPVVIGGDHSITRPSLKAFANANPGKTIGLIQFDTHFDVRNLEDSGPSNGTPFRGLLQDGVIRGENIVQIGIHGFSNATPYRDYVREQGITTYTMRQVRQKGAEALVKQAASELSKRVDLIYVTVDIDVLDISHCPGSPGAAPGGMMSWELFDAVYHLGLEPKVQALDLVELDPFRDIAQISVKTGCHTILSFLAGVRNRLKA
ncbi:agmatinase family protein [Brevibacillus dissolubilis]|uniref:agmatinase family protein n=1 Tax=Brevibacillus dissolubilis TaxID=1844116 RepID=UPI001117AAC0|nr:agmatinase family protein [Brevibacillus dissolubilis]